MPLPELIEIVPLSKPVRAEITVPGSKSITNRALVLAALADGETVLNGALWSEDTQVMADCLQKLGFAVAIRPDPAEPCNRTISVRGLGGKIPNAGTPEKPLELFVGNAGTAARFLAAMVCLGHGVYRLSGVPRMHERPQAALFAALRELGYRVDSSNDRLPAVIGGEKSEGRDGFHSVPEILNKNGDAVERVPTEHSCTVSVAESSQFASALLLCAKAGGWNIQIAGANEDEMPYVEMTRKMVKMFPVKGGEFQIEPDASSGSYFWAANDFSTALAIIQEQAQQFPDKELNEQLLPVHVANWPEPMLQIDANFPGSFEALIINCPEYCGKVCFQISRKDHLGDSIMTSVVIAPLVSLRCIFTDLGRLRVQECERVVALRTELTKCGAKVVEEGDTLTVHPSTLHGAEIETYNDHRMAMCFAILGLKVPGIKIKNPACVKKTFPNFFQKLAAPPPHGLGAEIRDASGRRLATEELFAD